MEDVSEYVQMPSTMWTLIDRARRGGADALDALLRKYRPPILAFVRNAGFQADEAEDLVQEVFLAVVRDDVLAKADQLRGRFRSLLLAVTRHAISAWRRHEGAGKRGGGASRISLENLDDLAQSARRDEGFDPLWVQNLVRISLHQLNVECDREGTPHFRALMLHSEEGLGYADIGSRLGLSESQVRNTLHQARLRLKRAVLQEIHSYASSRPEYESEVAYLTQFLD